LDRWERDSVRLVTEQVDHPSAEGRILGQLPDTRSSGTAAAQSRIKHIEGDEFGGFAHVLVLHLVCRPPDDATDEIRID
jgi:hypothetical protein